MSSENYSDSIDLSNLNLGDIVYVHHSLFNGRKVDDNLVRKGVPGYFKKPDSRYYPVRKTEDGLVLDMEIYRMNLRNHEFMKESVEKESRPAETEVVLRNGTETYIFQVNDNRVGYIGKISQKGKKFGLGNLKK